MTSSNGAPVAAALGRLAPAPGWLVIAHSGHPGAGVSTQMTDSDDGQPALPVARSPTSSNSVVSGTTLPLSSTLNTTLRLNRRW